MKQTPIKHRYTFMSRLSSCRSSCWTAAAGDVWDQTGKQKRPEPAGSSRWHTLLCSYGKSAGSTGDRYTLTNAQRGWKLVQMFHFSLQLKQHNTDFMMMMMVRKDCQPVQSELESFSPGAHKIFIELSGLLPGHVTSLLTSTLHESHLVVLVKMSYKTLCWHVDEVICRKVFSQIIQKTGLSKSTMSLHHWDKNSAALTWTWSSLFNGNTVRRCHNVRK